MRVVLDLERAFVAAATGGGPLPVVDAATFAAAAAVASRFLAIGTPRSFGVVGPGAQACLDAHATWFAPREVRVTEPLAGARTATLAEVLACDIVCVTAPIAVTSVAIRAGTHLNLAPGVTVDADLRARAAIWADDTLLGQLAAGFVDGRQLDEVTVFAAS